MAKSRRKRDAVLACLLESASCLAAGSNDVDAVNCSDGFIVFWQRQNNDVRVYVLDMNRLTVEPLDNEMLRKLVG